MVLKSVSKPNIIFPENIQAQTGAISVNGSVVPTSQLVEAIHNLTSEQGLWKNDIFLAGNEKGAQVEYGQDIRLIENTWDIFTYNREQIIADFDLITAGRKSLEISDPHSIVYGKENLFVEKELVLRRLSLMRPMGLSISVKMLLYNLV